MTDQATPAKVRLTDGLGPVPVNATEPMQRAMQRAVMLRKSMNDVWRAALAEAPCGDTVDAGDHWPTVKITVATDGRIAGASFYTPGLPPGVHDLWCVPVSEAAEIERLRAALLDCARQAERLKKPCGMDPEGYQAVRNGQYQNISTTAHVALGTIRGPQGA